MNDLNIRPLGILKNANQFAFGKMPNGCLVVIIEVMDCEFVECCDCSAHIISSNLTPNLLSMVI
jgi:hypothetical protein